MASEEPASAVPAQRPGEELLPPLEVVWEGSPTWRARLGTHLAAVAGAIAAAAALAAFDLAAWGAVPVGLAALVLAWQWGARRAVRYRVTTRRVEWERGLLSRRIDGIDVWQIKRVEYVQSLGDRLGGVSQLHLLAATEAGEIVLEGLPASREVYDKVATAVQVSRRRVVGVLEK